MWVLKQLLLSSYPQLSTTDALTTELEQHAQIT